MNHYRYAGRRFRDRVDLVLVLEWQVQDVRVSFIPTKTHGRAVDREDETAVT
jgi:hypothetical protein